MTESIWLAIISGLLTILLTVVIYGFLDLRKRITGSVKRSKLVTAAVLKIATHLHPEKSDYIIGAMGDLLRNGESGD